MSHFAKMQVAFKQKYEKELVKSLEALFGAGTVKVHNKAVRLGGMDSSANRMAHIVVSKAAVSAAKVNGYGGAYNDIGYERNEDGSYTFHYDKSDINKVNLDKISQAYAVSVSEKELKTKGYTWKKVVQKDGTVKLLATRFV